MNGPEFESFGAVFFKSTSGMRKPPWNALERLWNAIYQTLTYMPMSPCGGAVLGVVSNSAMQLSFRSATLAPVSTFNNLLPDRMDDDYGSVSLHIWLFLWGCLQRPSHPIRPWNKKKAYPARTVFGVHRLLVGHIIKDIRWCLWLKSYYRPVSTSSYLGKQ